MSRPIHFCRFSDRRSHSSEFWECIRMLWRVRFFKYGRTCYSFSTGNSLLSWPPPCIVWRGKLSAKLNCITDHRSRGHCLPFARPKNQAHGLKVEGVGFQLVIHCRGVPFSKSIASRPSKNIFGLSKWLVSGCFRSIIVWTSKSPNQSIGKRD